MVNKTVIYVYWVIMSYTWILIFYNKEIGALIINILATSMFTLSLLKVQSIHDSIERKED